MKKLNSLVICALPVVLTACGGADGSGPGGTGSKSSLKRPGQSGGTEAIASNASTTRPDPMASTRAVGKTPSPPPHAAPVTSASLPDPGGEHPVQTTPISPPHPTQPSPKTHSINASASSAVDVSRTPAPDPEDDNKRVYVRQAMSDLFRKGLKKDMNIDYGYFASPNAERAAKGVTRWELRPFAPAHFRGADALASEQHIVVGEILPTGYLGQTADIAWTDYYSDELGYLGSSASNAFCTPIGGRGFPESAKAGDIGDIGFARCYRTHDGKVHHGTHKISYEVTDNAHGGLNFLLKKETRNVTNHRDVVIIEEYTVPAQGDASFVGITVQHRSGRDDVLKIKAVYF